MAADVFVLAARSIGMEYTACSITPSGLVYTIAPFQCTVPEAIERTILGILTAGKNAGHDRLLLSDLTRRTTRFLQEVVSRSGLPPLMGDAVEDMFLVLEYAILLRKKGWISISSADHKTQSEASPTPPK